MVPGGKAASPCAAVQQEVFAWFNFGPAPAGWPAAAGREAAGGRCPAQGRVTARAVETCSKPGDCKVRADKPPPPPPPHWHRLLGPASAPAGVTAGAVAQSEPDPAGMTQIRCHLHDRVGYGWKEGRMDG